MIDTDRCKCHCGFNDTSNNLLHGAGPPANCDVNNSEST